MQELKGQGSDYTALEDWCRQTHNFGLDNRGTRAPKNGETRTYKAQKNRKGESPFLKIPLVVLGVQNKGARLAVRFTDDEICIRLPAPA